MEAKAFGRALLGLLILGLTLACGLAGLERVAIPLPSAEPFSTLEALFTPEALSTPETVSTPIPWPTSTPLTPDTGWQLVRPGMEVRSLNVPVEPNMERITMVRIDPADLRIRVLYQPGAGYPVSAWAQQTGALLVVNGGYFTPEKLVTGLTISDGERYGTAYGDYAGMLAVTHDETVSVRWLREWPYDPQEPLREAIQSFPVLVKPGGIMGFPADGDDGRSSRRTVVGQDHEGRLLLLIAPRGYLSLHQLSTWLAGSDLNLNTALNLDGGTSSGLWMPAGPQIDSMIPVPVAIAVMLP